MIELLGADPDLTVVGEAGSVAEAMVRERALLDLLGVGLTNLNVMRWAGAVLAVGFTSPVTASSLPTRFPFRRGR